MRSYFAENKPDAELIFGVDGDHNHYDPTDAPAGSAEKIEVLRKRVELGQPLWHPKDRVDFTGYTRSRPMRKDKGK